MVLEAQEANKKKDLSEWIDDDTQMQGYLGVDWTVVHDDNYKDYLTETEGNNKNE